MTDISDKAVQEALATAEFGLLLTKGQIATLLARIEADAKEIDRLRVESNRLHEAAMIARNEAMTERIKCNEARVEASELRKLQGCPHNFRV